MNTIQIIGLGAGGEEDLTIRAHKALLEKIPTFVRTDRHPLVKELRKSINIVSFDDYFEKYETFDQVYENILHTLLEEARQHGKINYCTAGSPYFGDVVTKKLVNEYKGQINTIIIDGMSFLDKCIKLSGYADYKNIKILDCLEADEFSFDLNSLNIITQVYDRDLASNLKLSLMETYPEDTYALIIDVLENNVKKYRFFCLTKKKITDFQHIFAFSLLKFQTIECIMYLIF